MSSCLFGEAVGALVGEAQKASEKQDRSGDEENLVPAALVRKQVEHAGLEGHRCAVGVEHLADVDDLGDGRHAVLHDALDASFERL